MKMGERIRELRLSKDMTMEELGKIVGVKKAAVQKWENGSTKNLKRSTIAKLSQIFNVMPSHIMGIDNAAECEYVKEDVTPYTVEKAIMLPIVGLVRAGEPILATQNIDGYFNMDSTILSPGKEYFMLKVAGDSMDKEFKEGSLLLIEKDCQVENGDIAVVLVNGYEATVKKIVVNNNYITLIPMSNNPSYLPKMINITKENVGIIGKVKMAIRQY